MNTSDRPLDQEIIDQLRKILASERFQNASKQGPFLRVVVRRAIRGKKTTEDVLAMRLFPDKVGEIDATDVRVTARNLRSSLKSYYGNEGSEDLVLIRLPTPSKDKSIRLQKGKSYTPTFSYNPGHEAGQEFKLGEYYRTRGMCQDFGRAAKHFAATLAILPHHIGAALGLAELWCNLVFSFGIGLSRDLPLVKDALNQASGLLISVDSRTNDVWQLRAVGAFWFMANQQVDWARKQFEIALKIDRRKTEEYPPYQYLLATIGEETEALRLAKRYLGERVDDTSAYVIYARVLMGVGQVQYAEGVLQYAYDKDRGNFDVNLLLGALQIARGAVEEGVKHLELMKALADETTYGFTMLWIGAIANISSEEIRDKCRKLLDLSEE